MSGDQVYFVTGVSRGLGAAIFEQLIEAGTKPVGIGRTFTVEQRASAAARACSLIDANLSRPQEIVLQVPMTASGVVFISNAGVIGPIGRVGGVSFTELSEAITTNLVAPMILASQLASICRAHFKRLNVLHIGSGAAKHPIQGWSTYCTAKAGASMFFACLAAENPSWKIIDADPGVIDTGMQAIIRGASREMFPAVDDFIELKDRGDLQDPAQVAKDLLRKIGH